MNYVKELSIKYADKNHIKEILQYDGHIAEEELVKSAERKYVLAAEFNGEFIGWLRYNLFWDNTPFMNMLYILEPYRGKGIGQALVLFWEEEMKGKNYELLVTSTQADECAQHFYRKLGYNDCGAFAFPGESLELMLCKDI